MDQKSWAVTDRPVAVTKRTTEWLLVILGSLVGAGIAYLLLEAGLGGKDDPLGIGALIVHLFLFIPIILFGAGCGGVFTAILLFALTCLRARRR
jgi:amino acid permease